MKIAQVSATFPPYMAGTGNVCYHYAIELAKLGHEVTVFTSSHSNEEYEYPNLFEVRRFKPLFRVGNAPFTPQLLSIKDFDIIHLHYPFFFGGEMIYLISKLNGQKYIITYHNDVILNGMTKNLLRLYNNVIMKSIIKNSDKICVTSLDYAKNSNIKDLIIILPSLALTEILI
jgi:glycosyltransferase involved in cell wall biosynthesis